MKTTFSNTDLERLNNAANQVADYQIDLLDLDKEEEYFEMVELQGILEARMISVVLSLP